MRRALTVSVLSGLICWAGSATAQVCSGQLSFAAVPLRAIVGIGLTSSSQTYQVGVRLGGRHVFGEADVGLASLDRAGSGFAYGAGFGAQLGGHDARVQLCPEVFFGFTRGPNDIAGTGIDYGERHIAMGADAGTVLVRKKSTQIVATATYIVVNARYTFTSFSADSSIRDSWSLLALGIGFAFNDRVSLVPSIAFPFGVEGGGGGTLYGFGIAMKLGGEH